VGLALKLVTLHAQEVAEFFPAVVASIFGSFIILEAIAIYLKSSWYLRYIRVEDFTFGTVFV